jgi:hypothetical protein
MIDRSEPYGKIVRRFWRDPEIRALPKDARDLLLYYFTSPDGNSTGVYLAPPRVVAHDIRLSAKRVEQLLRSHLRPWVTYDPQTMEVFVHNGARYQLGRTLMPADKRRTFIERIIGDVRSAKLRAAFLNRYREWGINGRPRHTSTSKDLSGGTWEAPLEGP